MKEWELTRLVSLTVAWPCVLQVRSPVEDGRAVFPTVVIADWVPWPSSAKDAACLPKSSERDGDTNLRHRFTIVGRVCDGCHPLFPA